MSFLRLHAWLLLPGSATLVVAVALWIFFGSENMIQVAIGLATVAAFLFVVGGLVFLASIGEGISNEEKAKRERDRRKRIDDMQRRMSG